MDDEYKIGDLIDLNENYKIKNSPFEFVDYGIIEDIKLNSQGKKVYVTTVIFKGDEYLIVKPASILNLSGHEFHTYYNMETVMHNILVNLNKLEKRVRK